MYAPSNSASAAKARVSSKSFSVSPGKPTIMSVVTARSGICLRASLSLSIYFDLLYPLCIAARIWSLPDCNGRCRCSQTADVSAIASMTSRRKSLGWGLVNLRRRRPSIEPISRRRSGKRVRGRRLSSCAHLSPARKLSLESGTADLS